MANRIFTKDIHRHHPHEVVSSTDQYYCRLANKILNALNLGALGNSFSVDVHKDIAVRLALYIEDVVSGTKIWQTFTQECKTRYGYYIPFYELDDYYPDEINLADVRFLLWHRLQCAKKNDLFLFNPENPTIAFAATLIMEILDEAWEEAPENEKLLLWMQNLQFDPDDFMTYRNVLEWLHYRCYLFRENAIDLEKQFQDIADMVNKHSNVSPEEYEHYNKMMYAHKVHYLFDNHNNLLALTTPQWAEKILGHHTRCDLISDIKVRESMPYRYVASHDTTFDLEPSMGDANSIAVDHRSVDMSPFYDKENLYLSGQLVEYGGRWWVNGFLKAVDKNEFDAAVDKYKFRHNEEMSLPLLNKTFLKATGGEQVIVMRDQEEVEKFLNKKLKFTSEMINNLPELDWGEGIAICCTPSEGIFFITNDCQAIASPGNPLYDKSEAEKCAMPLLLDTTSTSYPVARMLWENDYLPDAMYDNSLLGREHGRELFARNALFLIDYFHNNNPENHATSWKRWL